MKEDNKISFDMSTLSLNELIKVYESINNFLQLLEDKKIVPNESGGENG